jgi:hypothetical protein
LPQINQQKSDSLLIEAKFIIGDVENKRLKYVVEQEVERYNDVLILSGVVILFVCQFSTVSSQSQLFQIESYDLLTVKMQAMFKYATANSDALYFMKTDDDVFVQVDRLVQDLAAYESMKRANNEDFDDLYYGFFHK